MRIPIYLDYAATTPVDERVVKKMAEYMTIDGIFGNAASRSHVFGWKAEEAVEEARYQVASLIHADVREIIWTSGATESDNLAIKGAAAFYAQKGKHIITSKIEHKAVLDPCKFLEAKGYRVTYLEPNQEGIISPELVEKALCDDTILVSLMHVNNEIGTITDIAKIGQITRSKNILFHVDAAQSFGKLPIDVISMNIDMLSMSGHKVYAPKGIGALYVGRKPRVRLEALFHGGGHERGMRSGTLPTHQIVGLGEAARIAQKEMGNERERIQSLREHLIARFNPIEECYLNGHATQCLPGILNMSFNFVEGESLLMALKDLALSSGSACTSASLEPSYVLRALGRNDELAHSSLRFSLGRFTTKEEIDYTADKVCQAVEKLRELSPLWDMYQDGIDLETVNWTAH